MEALKFILLAFAFVFEVIATFRGWPGAPATGRFHFGWAGIALSIAVLMLDHIPK